MVYVLIFAAFAAFFVFSPSDLPDRNRQELTRRLGYKFRTPTFDPLVAELERIAEERELGSRGNVIGVEQTAKAKIPEAYRDSNDEGRLNISSRLVVLFPLVDHSPKDGLINYEEMSNWITEQTINKLNSRTGRELAFYDKNGDGAISFHEYLPQFTEEDIGKPFGFFNAGEVQEIPIFLETRMMIDQNRPLFSGIEMNIVKQLETKRGMDKLDGGNSNSQMLMLTQMDCSVLMN